MRAEHDRSRLRGAVGVGHRRLWQRAMDRLHQALADRRRAHADELHAGQVGAHHQVGFAQHHRHHRRYRRQPGGTIALDRLDIGARRELRQQHDGGVRGAGELGERQRIHMVERRGDQIAVAVEPGREPRLHHPEVALVRKHDALRRSSRPRGIEEHRRLTRRRDDRVERSLVQERIKAVGTLGAERDDRQIARTILAALRIAKHELGAGILDDEVDGLLREFEIHRHGDEARTHDAVVGREIFGAIGRKDRDPVAAREAALGQRPRDAIRHGVELEIAELARRLLTAEVDDRDLGHVAVANDQVAEIGEGRHRA
jgi:hypothetical protein